MAHDPFDGRGLLQALPIPLGPLLSLLGTLLQVIRRAKPTQRPAPAPTLPARAGPDAAVAPRSPAPPPRHARARPPAPLLHAVEVGRQGVGHRLPSFGRSIASGDRQVLVRAIRSASAPQPSSRAAHRPDRRGRPATHLFVGPAHVRRLARQDFAQDGAQAEDVGAAVQVAMSPVACSGCHVRRRAQQRAGFRLRPDAARRAGAPRRADRRHVLRFLMQPAAPVLHPRRPPRPAPWPGPSP